MGKRIFLSLFVFSYSLFLFSQTAIPTDTALRYGKLDNGLTYYIRHNNSKQNNADFYLLQNAGSILEEDNELGLAHFLEHMAFNGTKNFPDKSIINYMQSLGAKFGKNLNASTSLDFTSYKLISIPILRPSVVDSSLMILRDWSAYISLTDEEIEKERDVIMQEWRKSTTAARRLLAEGNEQKLLNSQYAKRITLGDTAIIKHFNPALLRDFYKKWYRPDLQAVVVVGNVDVNKVEQTIKELFSVIPKSQNPAHRTVFDVPDNKEPIVSIATDPEAQLTTFEIDFKHKPLADSVKNSTGAIDISLANSLIFIMLSDRFVDVKSQLSSPITNAYGIYRSLTPSCDVLKIVAMSKVGEEKKALDVLLAELQRIKRYGFSQAELDRAKLNKLAKLDSEFKAQKSRGNASFANVYMQHFYTHKAVTDINWEYTYAKQVLGNSMSLSEINSMINAYITDTNMLVDVKAPTSVEKDLPTKAEILLAIEDSKKLQLEAREEKIINAQLITTLPISGTIVKEETNEDLKTTTWVLSNGVRVILRPKKSQKDKILLSAYSEGGLSMIKKIEDLPTAKLADEIINNNGVGDFNQIDLKRFMSGKIVNVSPYINNYEEGIKAESSIKDIETMFQLTYLRFSSPRKDDQSFSNFIDSKISIYANSRNNPKVFFADSISFYRFDNNPRVALLDSAKLKQVNQDKALEIYKQRFSNPADFTFVIVGPFSLDSIKPFVLTYLGGLQTSKKKENWNDTGVRTHKGELTKTFEQKMETEKASVRMFYTAELPFTLKNILVLDVLEAVLKIRYTESIRENEGGSYHVEVKANSSNTPIPESALTISFDTSSDKAQKMISIVQAEIDSILNNGVRVEDLTNTKMNLQKEFTDRKGQLPVVLKMIIMHDKYNIDLQSDYIKTLETISSEEIQLLVKEFMLKSNKHVFILNPKQVD